MSGIATPKALANRVKTRVRTGPSFWRRLILPMIFQAVFDNLNVRFRWKAWTWFHVSVTAIVMRVDHDFSEAKSASIFCHVGVRQTHRIR